MDEIIDRIGRLGALSDVISIELNDSKLTKADWDAMQRLTGLQELEMGTPDWIETSAYKRTIPEGATVPKSLRIARLYTAVNIPAGMLMYGKEASNRKQEIDRQHHTIPNQRPKDKQCGNVHNRLWNHG